MTFRGSNTQRAFPFFAVYKAMDGVQSFSCNEGGRRDAW